MLRRTLLATAALGLGMAFSGGAAMAAGMDKVKACFIYVGPIGDGGWTFQHHEGALAVQAYVYLRAGLAKRACGIAAGDKRSTGHSGQKGATGGHWTTRSKKDLGLPCSVIGNPLVGLERIECFFAGTSSCRIARAHRGASNRGLWAESLNV